MRGVAIFLLCLPLLGLPGCFVFDELRAGQELMEAHSPRKQEPKQSPYPSYQRPQQKEPEGFEAVVADVKAWWKKASQKPPPQRSKDDVPVKCEIGGRIHFMYKSVCNTRGGKAV